MIQRATSQLNFILLTATITAPIIDISPKEVRNEREIFIKCRRRLGQAWAASYTGTTWAYQTIATTLLNLSDSFKSTVTLLPPPAIRNHEVHLCRHFSSPRSSFHRCGVGCQPP